MRNIALLGCAVERGGALTHKHFQMVFKGKFSSFHVLNNKIKVALVWHVDLPMDCVVSCKTLRGEGLHLFKGIVGYCMKGNEHGRFEFVHYNMYADDMNE